MMATEDLYKILQVDPEADSEVIEAAYRRLARKYHPDVNGSPGAVERMKDLNAAYHVLRNPGQRAAYDDERTAAPAPRQWAGARSGRPCHLHPDRESVRRCAGCQTGLCEACAARFEPASCPACVVRWARRRQLGTVVTVMAITLVVVVLGGLSVYAASRVSGLARLALGGLAVDLPTAAAVGCAAVMAALLGWALWDLYRLRKVVAEAVSAAGG